MRPTVRHQELSMKYDLLKKEHKALKKVEESHSALKKRYENLKHHYKIRGLKYEASKGTVTLRDSEVKDLKEKISKLSEPSSNNNNETSSRDDDDDEDVEVLEYVNKREKEKGKLVATN